VLRGVGWASGGRAVVFLPERGGVGVLCGQADARGFAWLVVGRAPLAPRVSRLGVGALAGA
jgi:hypothetical protein